MELFEAIYNRRSVFAAQFDPTPIDNAIVLEILKAANTAPTHKLTQPWRFSIVASEEKKIQLGELMGELYKKNTPEDKFSEVKYKKTVKNPTKCSHIIAISMHRKPDENLPEWEDIAAMSMAVQNLWLAATAKNLGGYWSSPKTTQSEAVANFLQLGENTKCYGFFYLSQVADFNQGPAQRTPIEEKITWL